MKTNLDKEAKLDYNILYNALSYDENTGIFTWKTPGRNRVVGKIAGTFHHTGYRYIELQGIPYSEHRLAWLYCFQEWPSEQIDHIDKNRSNNSLDNLREVSNRVNSTNKITNSIYGHNISKNRDKFTVCFIIDNVKRRFGSHNIETATKVRDYVYGLLTINQHIPSNLDIFSYLNINYTK
jgi:hypothetical protein